MNAPFTGGTPLQPWMTLALKHRHPRDNYIHFDEPTHIYTVNGSSKGLVSVSGLHHHLFPEFDSDSVIKNMMRSKKWPESRWYGMSPQAIKAAWSANAREASGAGTAIHLAIEMVMNDAPNSVDPEIKKTKEWEYFCRYWEKDSRTWEPWRTEWEVWDEEHKITGSIDMVFRNKQDGTFAIYDWKRSKEMKMENDWTTGLGPVSHLPDTNYWHYTLQLNFYRWILERNYGVKISEMALIVLHPNNPSYKKYKLNFLDEEIENALKARKRAVEEGSSHVYVFDSESDSEEPLEKMALIDDYE